MMISRNDQLYKVVDEAFAYGVVAMDTEFVWERTYFPQLGIVQLATTPETCYLIDVPALTDFSPLAQLNASPQVEMIFHDAFQDLTLLSRLTGVTPKNVFDTRLAAGFANLRSTLSLRDIVQEATQVTLAKTESRTNWLKRPLASKQVEYACDDVKYLFAVRDFEQSRIASYGNTERLASELAQLDEPEFFQQREPTELYLRIKGLHYLDRRELAVIRELAILREQAAIARDIPRAWVVNDRDLIHLAQTQPRYRSDIVLQSGAWSHDTKDHQRIIDVIEQAKEIPESLCPPMISRIRDDAIAVKRANALIAAIAQVCKPLGIDPQLVASRSTIRNWVRKEKLDKLHGWRAELVAKAWEKAQSDMPV